MPLLRVIGGPDTGKSVEVRDVPVTIGRSPECGLNVSDECVSLIHALVEPFEQTWRVRDLESSTGTVVNGERTFERQLLFGDVITVGETVILFGSGSERVKTETVGRAESPLAGNAGNVGNA